jgi:hypothetical protein
VNELQVSSLVPGEGREVPLFFYRLDTRSLKIGYSDAEGLPIAFLFHSEILGTAMKDWVARHQGHDNGELKAFRDSMLDWLANFARSPLPDTVKAYCLDMVRDGVNSQRAPLLVSCSAGSRHTRGGGGGAQGGASGGTADAGTGGGGVHIGAGGGDAGRDTADGGGGDGMSTDSLDHVVVFNCLVSSMPEEVHARRVLLNSYHLAPHKVRHLIHRANPMGDESYGVHIVEPQVLGELKAMGVSIKECDLNRDAILAVRDRESMYRAIIQGFTGATWLVYVKGLTIIVDPLLKWVAE